jgi:large repetitive protein
MRIAVLLAFVSGCTVEPVDFTNKRCPCDRGFECDEAHMICVEHVPNLVAWYPFDDGRSDGATDTSGSGHDARCDAGCPETIDGVRGGALDLAERHLPIDATGDLAIAGPFTAALWLRPSLVTRSALLAKRRTDVAPDAVSFAIELDAAGRASCVLAGSANAARLYTPVDSIVAGAWSHLAVTWDGANMTCHLDGVMVASDAATPLFDGGAMLLGGDGSGPGLLPFAGAIDDVRIYDRALGLEEVAELARP